jgi:hypothetical protein
MRKGPPRAGIGLAVELLVHDARGRGHPLHLAGADGAAAAGRVAVRDLAVVDDGHGLEAAVRVRAHAAPFRGRLEHHRAAVVEHEEGRERGGVVVVREQGAHRKTVADPVALRVALDE